MAETYIIIENWEIIKKLISSWELMVIHKVYSFINNSLFFKTKGISFDLVVNVMENGHISAVFSELNAHFLVVNF